MRGIRFICAAFASGTALMGCFEGAGSAGGEPVPKTVPVDLRADAVEPPAPVDVEYSIGDRVYSKSNMEPGTVLELGPVRVNTRISFRVLNSHGAGTVRANILTNDCFRNTATCSGPNCAAEAGYETLDEGCPNF